MKALVEKRNSKLKEDDEEKVCNTPRRLSRISFSRSRTSITGSALGNGEGVRKSQLLNDISREDLRNTDSPLSSTYHSRYSTQTEGELNVGNLYNSDSEKFINRGSNSGYGSSSGGNKENGKDNEGLCDIMKSPISSQRQTKNQNSSLSTPPKITVRKNIYPIRRSTGLNPNLNSNAIMSLYGKDAFDYTKQKGSKHIDLEKLESPRSGTTSPVEYTLPINTQFLTENRNDGRFDGDAEELERITKTMDEKLPGIGYYSNDTPEPKYNIYIYI